MFSMERDANMIARDTRRGKGNIMICSADVASAMTMAGLLDYQSALQDNLNVDSTGNTFAGVLNGRLKVYVDPYANMDSYRIHQLVHQLVRLLTSTMLLVTRAHHLMTLVCSIAHTFRCRWFVPLVRTASSRRLAFKTRYGLISNPFAQAAAADGLGGAQY